MANFLQNSPIRYKDYVNVNPVQAMTEVGVAREQELQLGVQKVNSYFEQIGGLDIARDVDKNYVQQRLGDLKSGITNSLSGDFSDQRIINQIGGAASQIYKDPQVQRAVISTGAIRKGASDFEQYKKDGKYSVAQQYVFDYDVNSYLTNQDPNATFNAKAYQYSDYRKKATDALKAATGDETIRDDAFTIGPNGQLTLSDTTIRTKLAGISPARVQQILMASLSPEDFQQISAEGRYNYSNKSPEQFALDLQSSYKDKRDTTVEYINKLEAAKSSTNDAAQINNLNQEIETEQQRLNGMEREYNNILLSGDPEQAKAQKGTFDFINGFSNAFAYKQTSQTYSGKTPQEMMMWREDRKWDMTKFQKNYALDLEKLQLERNKDKREQEKADAEKVGVSGTGLPDSRLQKDLPPITEAIVLEKLDTQIAPLIAAQNQFIAQNAPKGVNQKEWYASQKAAYVLNPVNVSPAVRDYFEQEINGRPLWEQEREIGSTQYIIQEANRQADAKGLNTESLIPKLPPVTLNFRDDGSSYTYTPKEFVSAIEKFSKYIKTTPGGGAGSTGAVATGGTYIDYQSAKKGLTPKEYKLFEQNQKGDPTVNSYVQNYNKAVLIPSGQKLKQRSTFIDEALQQALTANQQVIHSIPTTTPAQKKFAQEKLSQFITLSEKNNGAIANSPNFDEETARKLLDLPDASYEIISNEGTSTGLDPETYQMIVRGIVDKKPLEVKINITPEQKVFQYGQTAFSDPAQRTFNQKYEEQIRKAGGYSTQMNGKSYLFTRDFPNLSAYGVIGDINKTSSGKYYLSLQVRDPRTNQMQTLQYPQTPVSGAAIVDIQNALKDDVIYSLLNGGKTPTQEELKQLKEAAKRPIF